MKKTFIALVICLSGIAFFQNAIANEAQMKETMVKIVNQLQAIKPLINQAQREQPANPRIKVHFDVWRGAQGHAHAGLRQNIDALQKALIQVVNRESIEPRVYQPIKNDFIGQHHV